MCDLCAVRTRGLSRVCASDHQCQRETPQNKCGSRKIPVERLGEVCEHRRPRMGQQPSSSIPT
eukprot:3238727-Rhodomonas_salina.1